jgi:putative transposase
MLPYHEQCIPSLARLRRLVLPHATFRLLFVFVVLANERRRVVHFNVTEHPTSAWTAQQLTEAFPWDEAPRYLLRDRDGCYAGEFRGRARNLGIEEVLTTPHSPWRNPFIECLNGAIRRECLDHVVVLNERHLKRILGDYFAYYHESRTHLSLDGDCPKPRQVHPPEMGKVVELPQVGGLHHRYERRAA